MGSENVFKIKKIRNKGDNNGILTTTCFLCHGGCVLRAHIREGKLVNLEGDLGVDVPAEKFVEAIKAVQPEVVGMSALLTTAFESMKNTIEVIKDAGLRDQVKIMIGGGAVDEKVGAYAGADAYGPDAVAAVSLSKEWIGK